MAALSDITIADVKTYHQYAGSDKDAGLTKILPLVVNEIKSICRHDFESKTRTSEKPFIPMLRNAFYVKYYPVDLDETFTLTENGESLTRNTDFYVDADTGKVEKIRDLDSIFQASDYAGYWSTTRDGVVVSYTGGVDLAGAQDVLTYLYETVGIRAGIKKRTFTDNQGVENVVFISSVPKDIKDILNRYKHRNLTVSGVN